MTDRDVTESVVEQAALAWLENLGRSVKRSAVIELEAPPPKFVSGQLQTKNAEEFIQEAAT